jgi:hypothetical protein
MLITSSSSDTASPSSFMICLYSGYFQLAIVRGTGSLYWQACFLNFLLRQVLHAFPFVCDACGCCCVLTQCSCMFSVVLRCTPTSGRTEEKSPSPTIPLLLCAYSLMRKCFSEQLPSDRCPSVVESVTSGMFNEPLLSSGNMRHITIARLFTAG